MLFADRVEAGQRLAALLQHLRGTDVVVLGLPRGGVPVAFEIAQALDAPLDVIVVRKLGVPFQPELGMGAIGEEGVRIINRDVMRRARVSKDELDAVVELEQVELHRRVTRFRRGRPRLSLTGRTALIVDDGIATGSTARAACRIARELGAARVVLAAPVAPPGWSIEPGHDADEFVCPSTPTPFFAIGQFYLDFTQTSDEEVIACLDRAAKPEASEPQRTDEEVVVTAGAVQLAGHLTVPEGASGLVIFAHGSGSSRHSPRNQFVADVLNQAGLGTLLFDLLTVEEEADRSNVFDVELLAGRLVEVTGWLAARPEARGARVGYFGASTGAAAALWAATEPGVDVAAVVSRGGRPDLAAPRLSEVRAPTLLIVGGHDFVVLDLNQQAQAQLTCESELAVEPGATHLFEERGTLLGAAELARDWFAAHLVPRRRPVAVAAGAGGWDPLDEAAREEANGMDVYEDPFAAERLARAREEAEGVEVFEDPDAVIPVGALAEGSPGHETLAGDQAGLGRDGEDETREHAGESSYE
jgi:putative phosphoribosyl transferase